MIHFLPVVRFSLRRYRRTPGPALAAVLTLALGIGANTAIFSLVDGVTLRPLSISDPAHLLSLASVKEHVAADSERDTTSSFAEYQDIRTGIPAFADVAGVDHRGVALKTADGIQLLTAEVVTDNFFAFMGARPELGRLPTEWELAHTQSPVIVLSHATWRRVFGGDPTVIGRTVIATGGSATIVAVTPAAFRGVERIMDPQVYVPRSTWDAWFHEDRSNPRSFRNYDLYARLRPGATLDQARAQLQSLGASLASRFPQTNHGRTFSAAWEQNSQFSQFKILSILLLALGAAVLLIACVNIANLLLAINDARRREIAMRTALGAMRGNLVAQLVTEYALLAVAGIASALTLAQWLISAVPAFIPNVGFPLSPDFRIDFRVMTVAIVAGALSVLVCGVIPALVSTRTSPLEAMRDRSPPAAVPHARAQNLRHRPGRRLHGAARRHRPCLSAPSFASSPLTSASAPARTPPFSNCPSIRDGPQRQVELSAIAARVRALPGVKDATVSRVVPFSLVGGGATRSSLLPASPPPIPPARPSGSTRSITTTSTSWESRCCAAAPSALSIRPPPCA